MRKNTASLCLALLAGCVLGAFGARTLLAQQSGIQRVIVLRTDVDSAPTPREAVLGTAEIPAGSAAGRHTHPGIEIGYVLTGEARMEIDGEPVRDLKAGDAYLIPAGKAHDAKASVKGPAKVVAFYLLEKGKPLSTPAS